MVETPHSRLAATLRALEQRFGTQAVVRANAAAPRLSGIASGFAALDSLGCVPLGQITELVARPTAGITTLALCLITQAQRDGSLAAYIDLAGALDPHAAALHAVDLTRLWIVQPRNSREALDFLEALSLGGLRLIIFDSTVHLLDETLTGAALHSGLRRLAAVLNALPCAIVFLTLLAPARRAQPPTTLIEEHAAFRLGLETERWLTRFGVLQGYQARVTLLTGGRAQAAQSVSITIPLYG
jgi:RecA DNA recombination protein